MSRQSLSDLRDGPSLLAVRDSHDEWREMNEDTNNG